MRYTVRYVPSGATAVVEETMDAASVEDARQRMSALGAVVLAARVAGDTRRADGTKLDVAWWCRELHTLVSAGMTVVEAIETLAAARDEPLRTRVHDALVKSLREGRSLSAAMRSVRVFPAVLVAGITASERTSTLPHALQDYLRYDELLQRLRRQAVSAAIYPAVVVGLGTVIATFLLVFVIPRFSRMYVDFNGTMSASTQFVLWLSRALAGNIPLIVGVLAATLSAGAWAWRSGLAARAVGRALDAIEPLRRQWDHFRLAKLYQSLALMFKGGYTLDEALQVCEALDLGPRMARGLAITRGDIARGRPASAALTAGGLTDVTTERLLAVGERTGGFATVLLTIAERHAQRFETFVERATRIVEPLLLLVVALSVGGVVVMMYMPIFDIAGGIGAPR